MDASLHSPGSESRCSPSPLRSAEFKVAQLEYFIYRLEIKWQCNVPSHSYCVCTTDGGHYAVSTDQLWLWASDMVAGDATLLMPPMKVLGEIISISSTDPKDIKVVIASADIHNGAEMPVMALSKLLQDKLQKVESTDYTGGLLKITRGSMNALRFLGTSLLSGSDQLAMALKYNQTSSWIDKWGKIFTKENYPTVAELDKDKERLLDIMDNAVEMARPCYSAGVNRIGAILANQILACVRLSVLWKSGPRLAISTWILPLYILITPLNVNWYRNDPNCPDLVCALLKILRDDPIREEGSQAAKNITNILLSELAFSPYSPMHAGIGNIMARIVQLNSDIRPPSEMELMLARFLFERRMSSNWSNDPLDCRPWEIAIFESMENYDPSLTEVINGSRGLPSIIKVFQTLGTRPKPAVEERIAYSVCLRYVSVFAATYYQAISKEKGIVASLVGGIIKNATRYPTNAPRAIAILHIISEDNSDILSQIKSNRGDTELKKFQLIKVGGSRFTRMLHERAREQAKEIVHRVLTYVPN